MQNSEPTEAELERGILEAVRLGLAEVARTLSRRLEGRRTGEANVVAFPVRRKSQAPTGGWPRRGSGSPSRRLPGSSRNDQRIDRDGYRLSARHT